MTITNHKRRPKVPRVRAYPRMRLDHHQRLKAHCAARGINYREGFDEAMALYLDGGNDVSQKILRQLEKIALALEAETTSRQEAHHQTHLALEILSEAVGRFFRLWFFVHAAVFQKPATQAAAEGLYQAIMAKVAEYFRAGHRFVHDLPLERSSDWMPSHPVVGGE